MEGGAPESPKEGRLRRIVHSLSSLFASIPPEVNPRPSFGQPIVETRSNYSVIERAAIEVDQAAARIEGTENNNQ